MHRTASKLVAFLVILVPTLRGFVPKLRAGLRSLIEGLRILEGQTYSVNEARKLNIQPGGPALKKEDIKRAKTLIIEGLAMIEGCCPICCLVPALHCLCHYGEGAEMGFTTIAVDDQFWFVNHASCMQFMMGDSC